MNKWFPMKNELLYDTTIKARTKIVLAILYHHKNNSYIVTTTHAKLDKWTNISNSKRYLNELIKLGYIEKIKDGEYKINYHVKCKKGSDDKYSKIKYEYIFSYNPEDVINQCIIENILRMNKLSVTTLNNISNITMFLSSKNNKSSWNTIEEVNEVLNNLNNKNIIKYEVSIQCLITITDEDNEDETEEEQIKTAPEEQEAENDKMVSTNIIQQVDTNIINPKNDVDNDFFGDKTDELKTFALNNGITVNDVNLSNILNFLNKVNKNNTTEYLINKYYKGLNKNNTLTKLDGQKKKIEEMINSIGFLKTEFLIDFMINNEVNEINYIKNTYEQAIIYINNKLYDIAENKKTEILNIMNFDLKQAKTEEEKDILNQKRIKIIYEIKELEELGGFKLK